MYIVRIIFIASFVCLLSLPIILLLSNIQKKNFFIENNDLVNTVNFNKEAVYQWPKIVDEYLQESLPLRSYFVSFYLNLWEDIIGAPVKSFVTGKNGEWIPFLKDAPVLGNYLGLYPLTQHELVLFQLTYLGTYTFFQLHGIPYLLVTIPDKTTLHPDTLPFWAHWCKGDSHYAQRLPLLKALNIPWIDMLDVFNNYPSTRLYCKKLDTSHWNDTGRSIAYQSIATWLTQFDPAFSPKPIGTLYDMPTVEVSYSLFKKEVASCIKLLHIDQLEYTYLPDLAKEDPNHPWTKFELFTNKKPLSHYSILLIADSYMLYPSFVFQEPSWTGFLFPLAYHTSKFYKTYYNGVTTKELKNIFASGHRPDIVIEAVSERIRGISRYYEDPLILTLADIVINKPSSILITPQTWSSIVENCSNCDVFSSDTEVSILHNNSTPPSIKLKPIYTDEDGRVTLMINSPSLMTSEFEIYWVNENDPVEQGTIPVKTYKDSSLIHTFFFTRPRKKIHLYIKLYEPKNYTILSMPEEVLELQKRQRQTKEKN